MPVNALNLRRATTGRVRAFMAGGVAIFASAAWADDAVSGLFRDKWQSIDATVRSGKWEAYFTGYAWHLPKSYNAATRARLNETTWGGGLGRTLTDRDGDRHSVFVVGFVDSHRDPQFIASYGWQRPWVMNERWGLSWGYQVFMYARKDVARYRPMPAALPCVSIRRRNWETVVLFVPHVSKNIKGDVLFLFLRVAP